jgi:tRNA(fMet)-specific endonuclease VapC
MIEAMLDANLCIRVLRDRPQAVGQRFIDEAHTLAISTIVLYELRHGAEKSRRPVHQHGLVDAFAAHIAVLDYDSGASLHSAQIKAELEARGKVIGPNDLLIAGHARSLGLKLITGNLGEFRRVDGLRCEDWLAEEPQ